MTALRDDGLGAPLPARLPAGEGRRAEIVRRHDDAMRAGAPTYTDPTSGFAVFTASFLAERGYCCDSGCRHCPYEQRVR